MLYTKEYYDVISAFDKLNKGRRLDKESKDLWQKRVVYQDGQVNTIFLAFLDGYSFAKCYLSD